jgi:hypothetical protein
MFMFNQPVTPSNAAVNAAFALAEAIRNLGSVPSGHLYAQVMNTLSQASYDNVIRALVNAGLVRKDPSHLLTWIGPTFAEGGRS